MYVNNVIGMHSHLYKLMKADDRHHGYQDPSPDLSFNVVNGCLHEI
jgi:hypothetical protein